MQPLLNPSSAFRLLSTLSSLVVMKLCWELVLIQMTVTSSGSPQSRHVYWFPSVYSGVHFFQMCPLMLASWPVIFFGFSRSQYGEEEVCSDRLDADFPDFDLSQLDASDFDSVNCLSELHWCNEQSDHSPASIQYSAGDPELFEVGKLTLIA